MRLGVAILIACLSTSAMAQDAVGRRIAQSAAAAERLQGPLEGTWTLRDGRGRSLLIVQIGDPPSGGPLSCAWEEPGGAVGAARCRRTGGRLIITFRAGVDRAVLRPTRGGVWRGELTGGGTSRAVMLQRG